MKSIRNTNALCGENVEVLNCECVSSYRNLLELKGYIHCILQAVNPLTLNDPYRGRIAPLTSKRFILYIYSKNIDTEYLNMVYTLRFFLFKMQFVS